jgi:hypothetical protein
MQSESELAYAPLQRLGVPFLDQLDRLPGPLRDALATTYRMAAGNTPGRFILMLPLCRPMRQHGC